MDGAPDPGLARRTGAYGGRPHKDCRSGLRNRNRSGEILVPGRVAELALFRRKLCIALVRVRSKPTIAIAIPLGLWRGLPRADRPSGGGRVNVVSLSGNSLSNRC